MHDAAFVRVPESVGDLLTDAENLIQLEAPRFELCAKR
jgi:hypothetical protein